MKNKITVVVLALLFLPVVVFSQKAYNNVNYRAKTKDFVVKLQLADGYPEASTIKITDLKTKKIAAFIFCELDITLTGKKMFCCSNESKSLDPKRYVHLALSWEYESLPQSISANYFFKGKTYPFILTQQD